jgi:hypothetical protein
MFYPLLVTPGDACVLGWQHSPSLVLFSVRVRQLSRGRE